VQPPTFSWTEQNFRRRVTLDTTEENLGLEKDDVPYLKQNPTTDDDKRGSGMGSGKLLRRQRITKYKGSRERKRVLCTYNPRFLSGAASRRTKRLVFIECAPWFNNRKIERWVSRKSDNLALPFMGCCIKFWNRGEIYMFA